MKLDRNLNENGMGKYALIKLRVAKPAVIDQEVGPDGISKPSFYEIDADAVDFGNTDKTDFFVIRLRDKHAPVALAAYANSAMADDPEYAQEVFNLALMAIKNPYRKLPD